MAVAIPEWEYKVIEIHDAPNLEDRLNILGKEGWDLVHLSSKTTISGHYIFKRQTGHRYNGD